MELLFKQSVESPAWLPLKATRKLLFTTDGARRELNEQDGEVFPHLTHGWAPVVLQTQLSKGCSGP